MSLIEREAALEAIRRREIKLMGEEGVFSAGVRAAYQCYTSIEYLPEAQTSDGLPVWRNAEIELPPDDGRVLAVCWAEPNPNIHLEGSYQFCNWLGEKDGWMMEEYPECTKVRVTHWMPPPEPPEEVVE